MVKQSCSSSRSRSSAVTDAIVRARSQAIRDGWSDHPRGVDLEVAMGLRRWLGD